MFALNVHGSNFHSGFTATLSGSKFSKGDNKSSSYFIQENLKKQSEQAILKLLHLKVKQPFFYTTLINSQLT